MSFILIRFCLHSRVFRILFVIIVAAILCLPNAVQAISGSESGDSAWDATVKAWKSGESWKPFRGLTREEEYDENGLLISWEEFESAFSYEEGPSKPRQSYIKVIKNGKDVTAERKKQYPKGPPSSGSYPDPVPFSSAAAGKVQLGPIRPGPNGTLERSYRIEGKTVVVGTINLDLKGEPLGLVYSLDPLPPFVTSFTGSMKLTRLADSSLVPSELSLTGAATILVVKRQVVIRISLLDYRSLH